LVGRPMMVRAGPIAPPPTRPRGRFLRRVRRR
jgi:hypothetical protein